MKDLKATLSSDKVSSAAADRLPAAIHTVSRHALRTGLGDEPGEQAAFGAAWAATQIRLLRPYMERHAATAEASLASLPDGELKHALGIVLRNAADRCSVLARDLDLARGETLGTPPAGSAERATMTHRARHCHDIPVPTSGRSF